MKTSWFQLKIDSDYMKAAHQFIEVNALQWFVSFIYIFDRALNQRYKLYVVIWMEYYGML